MDVQALRGLTALAGTRLEGDEFTQVAALLDSHNRPDPASSGSQSADANVELESYRIDATAVGVFRISGGYVVATAELVPAPDAEQQAARKLAELNHFAERYGLAPYSVDDLDPWALDGEVRTTGVHGGYTEAAGACQDGRRRLLGLLLESCVSVRLAGWETEVVLLVPGHDYYILRTHRNGTIEISYRDQPLDASALYATTVTDLAEELVPTDGPHRLGDVSPLLPLTVRAWLYAVAAEALSEQAWVSLGVGLKGLVKTGELSRSPRHPARLSVAELASSLHAEPARLARVVSNADL